jgi:chaperone required for assembly of F1-ATPase
MQGLFCYSADSEKKLRNTQNAFAVVPLEHWLRERTAMLRYTHFAYLVFV